MRAIPFFILFLVCLIIDGILAPALFHVHESFLVLALMASFIAAYGIIGWTVASATIAALVAEVVLGFHPGQFVVSTLGAFLLWHGLTRFLSVKPYLEESGTNPIPHLLLGSLLLIALAGGFVVIERLYDPSASFTVVLLVARTPLLVLYGLGGQIVFLFIMAVFSRSPHSYVR